MRAITSGMLTHIGLALLLVGALVAWLGSSGGEQQVQVGSTLSPGNANWRLRVDETWREDHPNGQPKQWYTRASVIEKGKVVHTQNISVNAPLSFRGVDVYQAGWGPHTAKVSINGQVQKVLLQPMGQTNVGAVWVAPDVALLLEVRKQDTPMSVYVRTSANPKPQLLASLPLGSEWKMGSISMQYAEFAPSTLLKYKRDPGLPIVYTAFAFITLGMCMSMIHPGKRSEAKVA